MRELFRIDGTISRGRYVPTGLSLAVLKYALDFSLALFVWEHPWYPWHYWFPFLGRSASEQNVIPMVWTLFAITIPFLWIGYALTLRRVRDAALPEAASILFFVPVANVLFFLFLGFVPTRPPRPTSRPPGTASAVAASVLAILISVLLAIIATFAAVHVYEIYGWTLFLAVPFTMGFVATFFYFRMHGSVTTREAVRVVLIASVLIAWLVVSLAFEGVLCLVMALPIGLPLALAGAVTASRCFRDWGEPASDMRPMVIIAVLPLLLMAGESAVVPRGSEHEVVSTLDVAAPPVAVWPHVVSFPPIREKPGWLFRAGISTPVGARIDGEGPGAIRHCEFTTGAFVEPIEVWDPPRRLAFRVIESPPPMREWSPWRGTHPPHLDGFLEATWGEFVLMETSPGRTRIVATTRYRHGMRPAWYWRLWSDAIIHRIHLRVLRHIANEAVRVGSSGFERSRVSGVA